jgi:hypothetical protein
MKGLTDVISATEDIEGWVLSRAFVNLVHASQACQES